jgi:pimeloyl-ACP methyl ester carboxylesterase
VQWDQRQTGKTLAQNASEVPLTVRLFQEDTHDLIDSLLSQFGREKLFLLAHSWGAVLGFYIADKYPQFISAYIAISPEISQLASERQTLEMLKNDAVKQNRKKETSELSSVKIPFENGEQLYYDRKWLFKFQGQQVGMNFLLKNLIMGWSGTWMTVWNESLKGNLIEELPVIHCPVYFFIGRRDYQANFSIAEEYFKKLSAPKKKWFWFEKSSHNIPDSEPALLQDIIIDQILPDTQ